MGDIAFAVRPLPSSSLKGAFRIHITPEALLHLKLKVGEVCSVIGEDGTRGTAIAWRAADRMGNNPKIQPAKMTETLRDAFGFKQGTQIRIEKAENATIRPATRVSLTEITPVDYEGPDDDRWKIRCMGTLVSCEAFATGTTFDVSAGEGLKKRYFVESIDSDSSSEAPFLSYFANNTELRILDGPLATPPTTAVSQRPLQIDASRIGGLSEQVEELNFRLHLLCRDARSLNLESDVLWNRGVIIHGYEGTGKTLLLNQIAHVHGLNKIIRIDNSQLLNTPSKNQSAIQHAFREALSTQPSLILIDSVDQIARANDPATFTTATALASAFDQLRGSRVLVIGTTRSLSTVHESLLALGRMEMSIELPIPDADGRYHILSILLSSEPATDTNIVSKIAGLTHGFTGHDLARLVNRASFKHHRRRYQNLDERPSNEAPTTLAARRVSFDLVHGRSGSIASTLVDRPETPPASISWADIESALQEVRPSALKEIIVEPPKVTFNDIGGSNALQARFDRIIKWPSLKPELFAAIPQRKPKRGILLYGPPGCSKTMTAQAVASTYGWNFIAVKGAELISMYVGESERAIRDIFRKARQAAPTIIFFDEIDSIATARSGSADASKSLNVVTTLLTEMDGFEATKDVLVLAATNKPESLDAAILRPGRFDEHIYLGPPNSDARREILRICIRGAPGEHSIDLEPLLLQSDGMSGAEIKNAWTQAGDIAIERAYNGEEALQITTQDFSTSISRTQCGITKEMLQAYEHFANNLADLK